MQKIVYICTPTSSRMLQLKIITNNIMKIKRFDLHLCKYNHHETSFLKLAPCYTPPPLEGLIWRGAAFLMPWGTDILIPLAITRQ